MMAITTNGGRKPLSVPDNVGVRAEETAEAFATMTAYTGRYTLDGNKVGQQQGLQQQEGRRFWYPENR
jgi:Lipocalin-like domain